MQREIRLQFPIIFSESPYVGISPHVIFHKQIEDRIVPVEFVIDTGAAQSIIDTSWYPFMKEAESIDIPLVSVDGQSSSSSASHIGVFEFKGSGSISKNQKGFGNTKSVNFRHKFFVFSLSSKNTTLKEYGINEVAGILGMDFLIQRGATINLIARNLILTI